MESNHNTKRYPSAPNQNHRNSEQPLFGFQPQKSTPLKKSLLLTLAAIIAGSAGIKGASLIDEGRFGQHKADVILGELLMPQMPPLNPEDVTIQFHTNEYGKVYLAQADFHNPDFHFGHYAPTEGWKTIQSIIENSNNKIYWHRVSTLNIEREFMEPLPKYLKRVTEISKKVSEALTPPKPDETI